MAFSDLFSFKSTPAAPAANSTPAAAAPAPADKAVADGKMPGTDQQPVNPLDAYSKLWDTSATDSSKPPAFALDATVLDKVSSGLNFTQGVPAELMQKAMTGDTQAMMDIMNHVGQQAYRASLSHSTTLTDKFVGARSEYDLGSIGSKVKQELTSSALQESVPNASHPVVKQELKRIADAMQKMNPDSSPQEIAESAKQYFNTLYSAANPQPTQAQTRAASGEVDWDKYFN